MTRSEAIGGFQEFARRHGAWAAFCIVMFIAVCWIVNYTLKTSEAREQRLMAIIQQQAETQKETSVTLEAISGRMDDLSASVDRIERKVE